MKKHILFYRYMVGCMLLMPLLLFSFTSFCCADTNATVMQSESVANSTLVTNSDGVVDRRKDFWQHHRDILPYDFAYVYADPAPVFRTPYCDLTCKPPVDYFSGGFIWVSMEPGGPVKASDNLWYKTGKNRYMLTQDLRPYTPSVFKGVEFSDTTPVFQSGTKGWIILDTVTSSTPGKVEYIDGTLLTRHTMVTLHEKRHVDGWDWYRIGDGQWVDQRRLAIIEFSSPPEKIGSKDKWIEINLYEQTLAAYEGSTPKYVTIISSGLPGEDFETPTGLYRIWGKKKFAKMSGGEKGNDYYFLQDVPYHIYFYQSYAIHGAYWHDNFGLRQSHGCVNTSPLDAKWLFDWTSPAAEDNRWTKASAKTPGTWVWVHK